MANQKLTALTEDTTPSTTDIVYSVKAPGGTPLSRKVTHANLAVEGTSIRSTGETGGTKFLREDGDGTSSWQAVSGAYKNALINGDNIVSQDISPVTAATYPINSDDNWIADRLLLLSDGNDIVDYSQELTTVPSEAFSAIKLEVETINKQFGIVKIVEAKNAKGIIGNGACSLQFKARMAAADDNTHSLKAVVLAWDGAADTVTSDLVSAWGATATFVANWTAENTPASNTLTTAYQTFQIENIQVDTASAKNLAVFIYCDQTDGAVDDAVFIGDIQLEPGVACSEYERLPYDVQLARCQFYSRVFETDGGFDRIALGSADTTASGNSFLDAHEMRAAPTLVYSALSDFAFGGVTPSSFTITYTTKSNIIVTANVAGTPFTVASAYELRDANTTSKLTFKAEM